MKSPLPRSDRGAVLIVAMLLAAIIGISLVSFIKLSNNSLKQAHRTFYSNSAMNLAEVGLEEAISRFNQIDNVATPADAWPSPWVLNPTAYNSATSPWTPSAVQTFSGYNVGPNTTAVVKVYVQWYAGDAGRTPRVVAKSTITQPDGSPPISKYIEVELRKRGLFTNGLVARNDITWVGQPAADSWDSKHPYTSATADADGDGIFDLYDLDADGNGVNELPTPYDPTIRSANVVVGSIGGNIDLAGGEVWGYAKTGEFGNITGGSVHPLGTTTNDPTRRTNDFNATFPTPTIPTPSFENPITGTISSARTFPNTATDTAVMVNGVETYFYRFDAGEAITLAGSDHVQISAGKNVVFLMTSHAGATAMSVTGTATGGIDIGLGGSLNVYTDGNISIAGNGTNMANANASASSCIIYGLGTASGTQSISVSGNGQLNACVYAPNASVTLNGGGMNGLMNGAVVAKNITMNGHTEFHYDDALSRLTTGNPYGIQKWRELQTAAERTAYATPLNF
jgi:Tfp pilus assembly protein PilX